jgi:Niemann-Pick C1 protein
MRYSSLETDPVALWTPPNSRARLERDYFNERFGSIYRIEQIIIIAKNPLQNIINYTSPVEGEQSFGPILNPDFIRGVHLLESKIKEV